jgi:hypothetical protein
MALNSRSANEKCTCGHHRGSHADTQYEEGSGECIARGCPCKHFTWSAHARHGFHGEVGTRKSNDIFNVSGYFGGHGGGGWL